MRKLAHKEEFKDQIYGDEYDVMGMGIKVHSREQIKNLNEDFILSDLNDNERMFVRRGLRITRHIIAFLDVSRFTKEKSIQIDGEEFKQYQITEEGKERVDQECDKIIDRMLRDYKAMAILSRGRGARVVKALVHLMSGARAKEIKVEEGKLTKIAPEPEVKG